MSEENVKVSSSVAKFLIGVLAGCAAVAIPRLSSLLISGENDAVNFFPMPYITCAILFAVIVGFLVVVIEYGIAKTPKETLFAALAIPGVVAGSFNTVIETSGANTTYQKTVELSRDVRHDAGIQTEKLDSLEVIPIDSSQVNHTSFNDGFDFSLISAAYADDGVKQLVDKNDTLGVAIQRTIPKFAISIGNYKDLEAAIQKAKEAKAVDPTATLIKTSNGFEVLSNDKIYSETDATIEALKIKSKLGVTPKLLQVK